MGTFLFKCLLWGQTAPLHLSDTEKHRLKFWAEHREISKQQQNTTCSHLMLLSRQLCLTLAWPDILLNGAVEFVYSRWAGARTLFTASCPGSFHFYKITFMVSSASSVVDFHFFLLTIILVQGLQITKKTTVRKISGFWLSSQCFSWSASSQLKCLFFFFVCFFSEIRLQPFISFLKIKKM